MTNISQCIGTPCCEACTVSIPECVFELSRDKRRREVLRYAEQAKQEYRDNLANVMQIFKDGADKDTCDDINRMKCLCSVDNTLSELGSMYQGRDT